MLVRQFLVPVLVVLAAVTTPRQIWAENAAHTTTSTNWTLPIVKLSAVSNTFTNDFREAAKSIPQPVWQVVLDAGWRVTVAENVVDAAPGLRGITPRGWPAELMWDNTDAVHLPNAKLLIIAEKRRNKKGQIVRCNRVGGVLRHEVGHAFDVVSGQPTRFESAKLAFLEAYRADLAEMNADRRRELQYYVQQGQAGQQETFAEAFGIIFGGGSDAAHEQSFTNAFPRTIASVRRAIGIDVARTEPPLGSVESNMGQVVSRLAP